MSALLGEARYREGVVLFQEARFFEAHEELELVWRPWPAGPERLFLQGLIQAAVSLEHWRRANPRGAAGQYEKARAKLEPLPAAYAGLALGGLLRDLRAFYAVHNLAAAVAMQRAGRAVDPTPRLPWPAPRWLPDYGVQPPSPS